jgi:hypothetical protein
MFNVPILFVPAIDPVHFSGALGTELASALLGLVGFAGAVLVGLLVLAFRRREPERREPERHAASVELHEGGVRTAA